MPQTYKVSDVSALLEPLLKNVGGLVAITPQLADMVSSEMWGFYPWRVSLANIPAGNIPLVDAVQDYNAPTNIYRLLKVSITRTDTSPNENWELDVARDISVDLISRSYQSIRSACLQPSLGKIRLESAVAVPSGTTMELSGQFQMNAPKITALTDQLWFDDQHMQVFLKGMMYWAYKLSDDGRAGGLVRNRSGQVATGQFAEYRGALDQMSENEDYGTIETIFPGEGMGAGRDTGWGLNIWGL